MQAVPVDARPRELLACRLVPQTHVRAQVHDVRAAGAWRPRHRSGQRSLSRGLPRIHGSEATHVISCYLTKGKRTRDLEEELVSECLEALIGIACGVRSELPKLSQNIEYEVVRSQEDWKQLIDGEIECIKSEEKAPSLIFPGTFNPLHEGHLKIKELAESKTQEELFFEISGSNVDNTPLSFYEFKKTLDQFSKDQQWILTNAPTFQQKVKLFPKSTFVVGTDTPVSYTHLTLPTKRIV